MWEFKKTHRSQQAIIQLEKINLLLKHDDKRKIELCSNEWKQAKATQGQTTINEPPG
jgi:hypothetical protein